MSPRPVKAWGCAFKCGRIATKREAIARHEPTCMKNPERRACPTCIHDAKDEDGMDCEIGSRPADTKMTYNCQNWEPEA